MIENEERFKYLLDKYLLKESTQEEFYELFDNIENDQNRKILFEEMSTQFNNIEVKEDDYQIEWSSTYKKILRSERPAKIKYWRIAAAASLFMVCSLFSFWLIKNNRVLKPQELVFENDIKPSANQAVLTLSNGDKIILDDHAIGLLANEENANIEKFVEGSLIYQLQGNNLQSNNAEYFNTVEIPKGGQYQLVLPDGTKVWLNAASSLKFPVEFKGNRRMVTLTGEAYFEVAKNKKMPFIVKSKDVETLVLGTHFNIKAYDENPQIKVTLLEGAVKLTKGKTQQYLVPEQQGSFQPNTNEFKIIKPDLEEVMAWKNGLFVFENTAFDEVMSQIERRYDVVVKYEGKTPNIHFSGVLPRNKNLSQILSILEQSGEVDLGIEGKTIICRTR